MPCKSFGELAEWSIAVVLKTIELKGSGSSNLSLSAKVSLFFGKNKVELMWQTIRSHIGMCRYRYSTGQHGVQRGKSK